jgi:hypothetical protein
MIKRRYDLPSFMPRRARSDSGAEVNFGEPEGPEPQGDTPQAPKQQPNHTRKTSQNHLKTPKTTQ